MPSVRIIAACERHIRPEVKTFGLLFACAGFRISEALALVGGSLEVDEAFVAVRSLTRRKKIIGRQIPVPPEFLGLLGSVYSVSTSGERLWTWSRSRAWQLVKNLMKDARIEPGLHKAVIDFDDANKRLQIGLRKGIDPALIEFTKTQQQRFCEVG